MEMPEQQPFNSVQPAPPVTLGESPKPAATPNKSKKIRFVVGFLLGLVVVAGALTAYVYNRPISDPVVRAVVNVLPYPAVTINGEWVSIKDYLTEYDALLSYFAGQEEAPSEDELSVTVVDTIINKIVLQQLAAKNGVVLDLQEVETMMDEVKASPGGQEAFEQQLAENFGWTLDDFRNNVVSSLVLANQMTEYVSRDQDLQKERQASIDEAKNRLSNGDDFAVVAGDISEDFSAKAGGDIGFVPLSEMVEPWLSAIVDLEVDEVSEVVESQENFMIFKVTDRITKEEDEEIQLSVIMVNKRTLDEVVEEYLLGSEIKRFIGKI